MTDASDYKLYFKLHVYEMMEMREQNYEFAFTAIIPAFVGRLNTCGAYQVLQS